MQGACNSHWQQSRIYSGVLATLPAGSNLYGWRLSDVYLAVIAGAPSDGDVFNAQRFSRCLLSFKLIWKPLFMPM
ncbi:hypothetical protein ALON55S_02937 [Alishewanella longhuensis]